jgi:hypothetical protein
MTRLMTRLTTRLVTRWRSRPDPAELLAAHASGGLSPDEAAQVEAHLDEHPDARPELDAIAAAIAEVRAAEPRPADEPDWDGMAAEIQRACVESDRRWWRLGRRWTAAALGGLAVTGAILMFTRTSPPQPTAIRARDSLASGDAPVGPPPRTSVREPVSGASGGAPVGPLPAAPEPVLARTSPAAPMAARDAARIETPPDASPSGLALSDPASPGASGLPLSDRTSPGASGSALADRRLPALEPGDVADLTEDDDPPAIDPFGSADYLPVDLMADELPDEAIDAIDRLLAQVQAG